jgi:hypothetical protein
MPTWWTFVAAAAITTFAQIAAADVPRTTPTLIEVVDKPEVKQANAFYPGNRPPLVSGPFIKLPIGAIAPQGWLRKQLTLQADGMVGHLPELSKFVADPAKSAWASGTGEGDFPWEEAPYWLKGYADMGYILGDEAIKANAKRWIDGVLASSREDGWFGPVANLTSKRSTIGLTAGSEDKTDFWPNMPMLNVLQSWYEYTNDPRVLDVMGKYFRYQLRMADDQFLVPYWQQQRGADNLASVHWLYNRTGEPWLLELAEKIHRHTAGYWKGDARGWHGVNVAQAFRGPAQFFQQSHDVADLRETERLYQQVYDLYGQVPGGMFGADERVREGFGDPRQAAETCSMVETMQSHEMLLLIDGSARWADRCEDVAFNSLPAAFTADFKALHYMTSPNLIEVDAQNKSPSILNKGNMFQYSPFKFRCCQHNASHGWPYFAEHLYLATPGNGLAAVLFAPSAVIAKVGAAGTEIRLVQETDYPFREDVNLKVESPKPPATFPLFLRIPGWCHDPQLWINGAPQALTARPGAYIRIQRTWADGDAVRLRLPMPVTMRRWPANRNSASVQRGPLSFSLKIQEQWEEVIPFADKPQWPAWNVRPQSAWNYGLIVDRRDPNAGLEVVETAWPADDQPFAWGGVPVVIKAKGKQIPDWKRDDLGMVGLLPQSPVDVSGDAESIELIPMGAARLRISQFPVVDSAR